MKKIAILVSQYNSGEWIENRISNILQSDLSSDIEIVCINSASPDPRDASVPPKYPVTYIETKERVTIYEAWNIGIQECDAEYITNMNTDDLNHREYCTRMSQILDGDNRVGVAYCSWTTIDDNVNHWGEVVIGTGDHPGNFAGCFERAGVGHFPMWRKDIHDRVGYFRTDMPALGDAEMWMRVWHQTEYRFHWTREILGAYRWRNGENAWNKYITGEQWDKLHELTRIYSLNSTK
jgi:GT2 family glycosyltransferase